MAFTTVTITGSYETPAGQPAQGVITATLSEPIQNGTTQIDPTPIQGQIVDGQVMDNSGELPFTLVANNDPATLPVGSSYQFTVELDNAPLQEFNAVVPYTAPSGTVDLSALA